MRGDSLGPVRIVIGCVMEEMLTVLAECRCPKKPQVLRSHGEPTCARRSPPPTQRNARCQLAFTSTEVSKRHRELLANPTFRPAMFPPRAVFRGCGVAAPLKLGVWVRCLADRDDQNSLCRVGSSGGGQFIGTITATAASLPPISDILMGLSERPSSCASVARTATT